MPTQLPPHPKALIRDYQPGGGLTRACGRLKTLYGEVISEWVIKDGTFEWTVIVPPNTTATFYLPMQEKHKVMMNEQVITGSVHEVKAGAYRLVVG